MPRAVFKPQPNFIDRLVGYFDPEKGLKRLSQRHLLDSYTATKPSRFKRDRETSGGSGEDHLNQLTLWELREISRELCRNNGLVFGALERLVQNVLGPEGPSLQSRWSDEEARNDEVETDWYDWLANDADISGELDGQILLALMKLEQYCDGDHFAQFDPTGLNGNGSLRPFEGDRVLTPTGVIAVNGLPMINGVTYDPNTRQPKWYFVANDHPVNGVCALEDGKFIRAETVIHFKNPNRISQGRGRPILTPSFRDIDDLDDLMLYEKVGAKQVASGGYVVETEDPYGFAEAMRTDTSTEERLEQVEPGSVTYMNPGESVKSIQSNRPGNNFEPFTRLISRFIGLPIGMPIELLLLDFSQINFSGSRQLLHLAQLGFRTEQYRTRCQLTKIYRWWLGLQIARGKYDPKDPKIFRHEWGFAGWPSPKPEEDAKAFKIELETRTNSRHHYNRSRGRDFDRVFAELAREEAMLEKLKPQQPTQPPAGKQDQNQQQQGGDQ